MDKKSQYPASRSPKATSLSDLAQYGKIPPQAIELEEAVLGALMLEESAFDRVAGLLNAECFYKEEHRKIFETIAQLNSEGKQIDLLMVTRRLHDTGQLDEVGGPAYTTMLTSKVASAAHIQQHAQVIFEKYLAREIIRTSSELINIAFSDSFDELADSYMLNTEVIDGLMAGKSGIRHVRQVTRDTVARLEERAELARLGRLAGVTTGSNYLNYFTNGWRGGQLIVVGARPSMGKTALAINLFAKRAAEKGTHVCVFSLEMDDVSLVDRLVLSYGGIDINNYRKGKLTDQEWQRFNQSAAEIEKLPIWVDDTAKTKVNYIRSVCRTKVRKHECGLVVIDYLQLIETIYDRNKNREREIAEISRNLKLLAKELDVPVVLLCQLNRGLENREEKKPRLADLRESGSIEQDADVVIFPWRPHLYGMTADNGDSLEGVMYLEIAKQRNGPVGSVSIRHSPDMTSFFDNEERLIATPASFTEPGEKEAVPY